MQGIHIHICQGYPMYVLLYPLYPRSISKENIPNDIQLWFPDYIQIYPFVSNIDISIRYPWCYPIWLSFLSLSYIQPKYPWWYPIMISWLHPSIFMFSPLISHFVLSVTWCDSSDRFPFISQQVSFHIITVILFAEHTTAVQVWTLNPGVEILSQICRYIVLLYISFCTWRLMSRINGAVVLARVP